MRAGVYAELGTDRGAAGSTSMGTSESGMASKSEPALTSASGSSSGTCLRESGWPSGVGTTSSPWKSFSALLIHRSLQNQAWLLSRHDASAARVGMLSDEEDALWKSVPQRYLIPL